MLSPRPDWVPAWARPRRRRAPRLYARYMEAFAGLPLPHRRPGGPGRRPPRPRPATSTTRSSWSSPTTGPAPRADRSARSTTSGPGTACPARSRRRWPASTTSAGPTSTTTTRGAGRWPATRRSGGGSGRSTRAGVADPMIVHWPAGIAPRGEVRHQYVHAIDVAPTLLDLVGVEPPTRDRRRRAAPAGGRQLRRLPGRRRCPRPARRRSTTRCSAAGPSATSSGRRSSTTRSRPTTRRWRTTPGSSTTSGRPVRDERPRRPRIPTSSADLVDPVVGRGGAAPRAAPRQPAVLRVRPRPPAGRPVPRRPVRLPAGHVDGPRGERRSTCATGTIASSPTSRCRRSGDRVEGVLLAQGSIFGGWSFHLVRGRLVYVHNNSGLHRGPRRRPRRSSPPGPHRLAFRFHRTVGPRRRGHALGRRDEVGSRHGPAPHHEPLLDHGQRPDLRPGRGRAAAARTTARRSRSPGRSTGSPSRSTASPGSTPRPKPKTLSAGSSRSARQQILAEGEGPEAGDVEDTA